MSTPTSLAHVAKAIFQPGYLPGMKTPCARLQIGTQALGSCSASTLRNIDNTLHQLLETERVPEHTSGSVSSGILASLLFWSVELQRKAGVPLAGKGIIIDNESDDRSHARLALPVFSIHFAVGLAAFDWVLEIINAIINEKPTDHVAGKLPSLLEWIPTRMPPDSNTLPFISAAIAKDIPFMNLSGKVYQYGQGVRSRWMDSSFSDATPQISSNIAREKLRTGHVLGKAGLPTSPKALATTEDQAVAIARDFGYPVVVKPANMDGGVAVAAGLRNPEELLLAYRKARKASDSVLVEKHFDGRDYRLQVLQGKLIWAVERVPGGVTGDGVQTVNELLTHLNADPDRGTSSQSPLKQITLDDDARALLKDAGMDEDSIPPDGIFVRLRRVANVATGGRPEGVLDKVHPDNRRLAEYTARLMKLDIAGIDLLIPDISVSWLESGASICEVNSQPTIGLFTARHLYERYLDVLVKGDGRIPVIAILGEAKDTALSISLERALRDAGIRCGRTDGTAVFQDSTALSPVTSVYRGGVALSMNTEIECILLAINDFSLLDTGLPTDHIDHLVIADAFLRPPGKSTADMERSAGLLRSLYHWMRPAVRGRTLLSKDTQDLDMENLAANMQDNQALVDEIVQEVTKQTGGAAGNPP